MQTLRCLILEDEPLAAEIIQDYIEKVPFLEKIGHCQHATEALGFLKEHSVEVLFLDLHLPGLKGFDFLRTLITRPQVIVTTAYHEYALEGYELQIVDYLMKPISFTRFLSAVNKLSSLDTPPTEKDLPEDPTLYFLENRQQVPVKLSEIMYVESQRDYVCLYLKDRQVKTKSTLHAIEKKLPSPEFIRIHRSFIVAKFCIDSFDASSVQVKGKTKLPIGRNYKLSVMKRLKV